MILRNKSTMLPRRTVLRGILGGAAIALPLPRLVGMLDGNGTAYADGSPLRPRYLTWFFGNGAEPAHWVPTAAGVGDAWAPSPALMPLLEFKPWLSVLSGYDVKVPQLYAHKSAPSAVLTGAQAMQNGDVQRASIDQIIAPIMNADTAFPGGLHVGISDVTGAGALDFNISFVGPNAPNPPNYSPASLFNTLLALSGTVEPDPSLFRRKAILDAVSADAAALRAKLGAEDRIRLDRHLEGVGQLQSQIDATIIGADCGMPTDPDVAYPERGPDGAITRGRCEAFAELLTFAFSCELTRVATHVFSCAACHAPYPEAGLGQVTFHEDYGHRLSPMGTDFGTAGFRTGVEYTMGCLAELLRRFRDTPDGVGNLLDNSLVYVTSCVGQPWDHRMDDYPLLLAGKAGGLVRGDVHFRSPGDNASRVPFTVMKVFGGPDATFGAGEGMVDSGIPELLV